MDYEGYIRHSYRINKSDISADDVFYFGSDGTLHKYNLSGDLSSGNDDSLYSLLGIATNRYNQQVEHSNSFVGFVYCFSQGDFLFCNTNKLDYCVYHVNGSNGYLTGYTGLNEPLDELSSISNYYQGTGYGNLSDFDDEGSYLGNYSLTISNYGVFDYTNLRYDNINDGVVVIRGENYTFYNVVQELVMANTNNFNYLEFYYGDPIASLINDEYNRGFGSGYSSGWVDGNDNGYRVGLNAGLQGGGVNVQQSNAFAVIGQGFTAVADILSIQVLPNITLGLCFSIPMTFVLIMTIFKLMRK